MTKRRYNKKEQRKNKKIKNEDDIFQKLASEFRTISLDFKHDPSLIDEENKMKESLINFIKKLENCYPEIKLLATEVEETPEKTKNPNSLGQLLYKKDAVEYDKTIVSIFCIFWLYNGDYISFTACQNPQIKLTKKSFDILKEYVFDKSLKNEKDLMEALIVFTVINDLGKVKSVVNQVKSKTHVEELDHDKILSSALKLSPDLFQSFHKLKDDLKKNLIIGLEAQFNFAQFVQGENLPANLAGLQKLGSLGEQAALVATLFNLHALFDMAGAAAMFSLNGSLVLTEETYHDIMFAIQSVESVINGSSVTEVYCNYMNARGKSLKIIPQNSENRAILRLCCMSRYHEEQEAKTILDSIQNLPSDTWNRLIEELDYVDNNNRTSIVLYYAPALLCNVQRAIKSKPDYHISPSEGMVIALKSMDVCFTIARSLIQNKRVSSPIFTANINSVAFLANDPSKLKDNLSYEIEEVGEDINIIVKK